MPQQCVGQAEIAFRIFKINRIDFVRHRRGTDLAGFQLLPEQTQRDIAPDVAVKVDQNRIDTDKGVEQLGQSIVRFDLDGVRIKFQAQPLDETARKAFPVKIRIRRQMRVVIADRAVDFAQQADARDAAARAIEPGDDVGDFLAERRRRGRLPMGTRHHRQGGMHMRQVAHTFNNAVKRR